MGFSRGTLPPALKYEVDRNFLLLNLFLGRLVVLVDHRRHLTSANIGHWFSFLLEGNIPNVALRSQRIHSRAPRLQYSFFAIRVCWQLDILSLTFNITRLAVTIFTA
jgi:hypothetical protein